MTEWEKMMSSQVYNDFDEMMFAQRVRAKKLFRRYNQTPDDDTAERGQIMNELFGKVGENVWIEPDFHCEFGCNLTFGNDVYINFGCVILDCNTVTIGNNTMRRADTRKVYQQAYSHRKQSMAWRRSSCAARSYHRR